MTLLVFAYACAQWVRRRAWVINGVTAARLDGALEAGSDRHNRAAAGRRTETAAAAHPGVSRGHPVRATASPRRLRQAVRAAAG